MREIQHGRDQELPPPMPVDITRLYSIAVHGDGYDHLYRVGVMLDNMAEALPDNRNLQGMAQVVNDIVGQISEQDTRHSWRVGA